VLCIEANESNLIPLLLEKGCDVIPGPFSAFGGSLNCLTLDVYHQGPAAKSSFPNIGIGCPGGAPGNDRRKVDGNSEGDIAQGLRAFGRKEPQVLHTAKISEECACWSMDESDRREAFSPYLFVLPLSSCLSYRMSLPIPFGVLAWGFRSVLEDAAIA